MYVFDPEKHADEDEAGNVRRKAKVRVHRLERKGEGVKMELSIRGFSGVTALKLIDILDSTCASLTFTRISAIFLTEFLTLFQRCR